MGIDPTLQSAVEMSKKIEPWQFKASQIPELRRILETTYRSESTVKMEKTEEIDIKLEYANLKARMYTPFNSSDGLIIYFHGGGFIFDSIDSHDDVCRLISDISKCRVLSVGYRLAPEFRFPSAVMDAYNSFLWVLENAEKLNINRNRIAIMGDSSGGNLCGAASLMLRDNGKPLPAMQILVYPFVGLDQSSFSMREYSKGYRLDRETLLWIADLYLSSREDFISPYFSLFTTDSFRGVEDTLIVTGEYDPLRDMGESLADRMTKDGVNVTCIRALGMVHGFVSFTSISPAAKNIMEMISFIAGRRLSEK